MARISTYALDEKITGGDKWIGSDSGFYNKTKNFTPLKLADYFNSSEKIDSTNSLRFWYQTLDFQEDRSFGTISFENEIGASVSFSSITSFLLSKKTEGNIFVYDFLSSLIDSKVLLHQGNTMNLYAIYEVTNIEEYELDSNFIKVDVSFIRGNGSLIEDLSYLLSVVDFALEQDITKHSELTLDDGTNPHGTTKNDVGLNNVDNTSDVDKPISTATQQVLDLKADAIDLDNLVPYTGATQDVDLGEFELKAGQVEFDTTPTGNEGVGILRWNDSDGTLDLGLKGGNVTLQIGQEQVVRVVNKTGFNLLESNYQAVRVNGAQGQRLKVDLAQATNDLLSAETIGLVTENIDNNQEGFVTTSGLIRGINTTGSLQGETWADGDILYLSPFVAGRITNIKPSAPNHLIVVGYVVYAHANNGSIFVKVDNGYELEELHNVTETNYTTPIDADSLLTFDITNSLWKRLSWSNIKSNLKTYFDTIYQTALGFTPENVANKANDLTSPDNTKYPTTQTVVDGLATKLDKSTTPSSVYGTDTSGGQTMIPLSDFGTVKGTGTTNRISKFTASGTIGDSQIFDNGTNVGVGAESTSARLDVRAQGALATDIAFRVRNSVNTQNSLVVNGAGDVYNRGAQGVASNTFFGESAGRNATGNNNIGFGYQALQTNTTGSGNSAFGYQTLFVNTIGYSNSAFGNNALRLNSLGNNNSAFGNYAISYNTTGSNNSAFGNYALSANTTSSGNSAFGAYALFSNTTGNQNIAFGYDAGRYTNSGANNQTSINSVYFGFDSRASASGNTNEIVIGHSSRGDGSNSVVLGNSSITRTRLQGQVIMGSFATAPTGIEGAIYYNSTDKKHYGFNGTTWNALY